ncbi:MAG: hypothetical protein U1A72_08895, partial [Sulfuritalea sp.]|nr:hypothetical protein [Sulfuritalea sp.]
MAINVFEGARRITKLVALLAVVGTVIVLFDSKPYVTATFTVSRPDKVPVLNDPSCIFGDTFSKVNVQESVVVTTKNGTQANATICFLQMDLATEAAKFGGKVAPSGKNIVDPFDAPSGRWLEFDAPQSAPPPIPEGYRLVPPTKKYGGTDAKPRLFDDLIPKKTIPYYVDPKTGALWSNRPDTPEVRAYINRMKESFSPTQSDEEWIDAEWWRIRGKGILEGVLFLIVGRSRYAEESPVAAPRINLHLHPLNSEGMILQYFVRINQHDERHLH